MIPKLAQIEDLRKRGGVAEGACRAELAQVALEQSTLQLQELLETGFDRVTVTDTFFVDVGRTTSVTDPHVHLYSQNAYHNQAAAVSELKWAALVPDLATATVLNTNGIVFDDVKGIASLVPGGAAPIIGQVGYISYTYTCGFTTVTEDPYGDYYQAVPTWLQEICASLGWNRFIDLAGQPKGLTKLPTDYVTAITRRNHRRTHGYAKVVMPMFNG